MKKLIVYVSNTGYTETIVKSFNGFDVHKLNGIKDSIHFEISTYNQIIIACSVQYFTIPKKMRVYLKQLKDLNHKIIDVFVTQSFRFSWLGGTQALRKIRKIIDSKNGEVRYESIVTKKSKKSIEQMTQLIRKYSK